MSAVKRSLSGNAVLCVKVNYFPRNGDAQAPPETQLSGVRGFT